MAIFYIAMLVITRNSLRGVFLQDHTGCHHGGTNGELTQVFQMRDPKNISNMLACRRTRCHTYYIFVWEASKTTRKPRHTLKMMVWIWYNSHFKKKSGDPPNIFRTSHKYHPQITSSKFKKCNKSELGTSPFCFLGSKRNSPVASSKNMHAALHTLNTFWRNGKLTIWEVNRLGSRDISRIF